MKTLSVTWHLKQLWLCFFFIGRKVNLWWIWHLAFRWVPDATCGARFVCGTQAFFDRAGCSTDRARWKRSFFLAVEDEQGKESIFLRQCDNRQAIVLAGSRETLRGGRCSFGAFLLEKVVEQLIKVWLFIVWNYVQKYCLIDKGACPASSTSKTAARELSWSRQSSKDGSER